MNILEDKKHFDDVITSFEKLSSENASEAFELSKKALVIAQRFNEMQFMASKIENYDQSKTEIKAYFHQCYSVMSKIHETCRMVWRQNNEQALYFERQYNQK